MFSGQRPAEVLIADDESIARDVLQFYLESLGCRVHAANDGNEALAFFRDSADRIELIILDARMPGPPPIQLYNAIRQISPCVPVLFCSGVHPDDPLIREINERGLQLFSKPFNRSALREAILEAMKAAETLTVARYHRAVTG